MKGNLLISVDAGRNGIKYGKVLQNGEKKKDIIFSKFGHANFAFLKTLSSISFDRSKDLICQIDDSKPIIFGSTCDKLLPPEEIRYAGVDENYLKYAGKYTLLSVANLMDETENNSNILLTINLTHDNMSYTPVITQELKGFHNVKFFDTKEEIIKERNFTVERVAVYYQSQPTVMEKAINDKLEFDPLYAKDGLSINIGRKTTEISLVRGMEAIKPYSCPIATEDLFAYIKLKLYERFKIRQDTKEIERILSNSLNITDNDGNIINLKEILNEAILQTAERIQEEITELFGNYVNTVEWMILSGGGAYYFGEILKHIYKKLEIVKDPVYANCSGMLRLLQKFGNR